MKKNKTLLCTVLILAMTFLYVVPAYAALPNSYYSYNDSFNSAVKANDYSKTIDYGTKIINLISKQTQTNQTKNILGSKIYEVAFAYYLTGDYENALKYFRMYLPYGNELGWTDGVKIAEEFIKQLPTTLEVYQPTDRAQKRYGVKNEPDGVLYGQVSEKMQSGDSMVLLYIEYGDTDFSWAHKIMRDALAQGKSVELALNYPKEGTTAKSIKSTDSYLDKLYSFISYYNSVPVFLRIGAEFNIWDNKCKPDEFISSFRTIADKVKGLSNVSIVWGVAHTSTWKTDAWPYTMDDYYPGDNYVDWIGTNCYANKYFQGKSWSGQDRYNEVCFKSGYSSDPVLMIKDIVDKYGDRKPIMLSECGASYRTNGSIKENHNEWAADKVKEMYSFVPMVYPQVKLIAYFNAKISKEINYYDLDSASALKSAYNQMVQKPWFVHGKNTSAAEMYFKKAENSINIGNQSALYAYPHIFGADNITVSYYIDGKLVSEETEAPYEAEISGLRGTYTLKVVAKGNNGASISKEYTVNGSAPAEKADDFTDSSSLSSIQKTAVDYTVKNKIISGYEDNTLRPGNSITRGEFATMVCHMMGYDATEKCSFDDARDHWASKYINACVKANVIHGVGNNKFAPDSNITLEQAVTILTQAYGYASSDTQYPYGFMASGAENNMLLNLTSDTIGTQLKRIDSAMLMYNAANAKGGEKRGNTEGSALPVSTPAPSKSAKWSEWSEELPFGINRSDYDIESKTQYSYKSENYIELNYQTDAYEFVSEETSYGNWSDWSDTKRPVLGEHETETRTVSTGDKQYHYAHYCTGRNDNPNFIYQSANYKFCDEASYHDLGWFNSPLPYSDDSTDDYAYYINGEKHRCTNSCYRWYLVETKGVEKTQYRTRSVLHKYKYKVVTDWCAYTDKYPSRGVAEIRERTVYRYREK